VRPFAAPQLGRTGGDALDAAAEAYIAAAGITNDTRKGLVRDFFTATASIRPKLDRLYLLANSTSVASRTDLILPSRAVLTVGGDTEYYDEDGDGNDEAHYIPAEFEADRGWRGKRDTLRSLYGDIDFATAKAGTNGIFIGAYLNTADPQMGSGQFFTSVPNARQIILYNTGGQGFYAGQAASSGSTTGEVNLGGRTGFIALQNDKSTTVRLSRNASTAITSTQSGTVTALTATAAAYYCRSYQRQAFAAFGDALTDTEVATLYSAVQAYLTAIGAQA
jgi:hypothetical protein